MIFGWSWDIFFLALLVIWGIIYARGKKHGIVIWAGLTFFTSLAVLLVTKLAAFVAGLMVSMFANIFVIAAAVIVSLVILGIYRRRQKSGGH